ncbi:MAG: PH domain-containing protein [Clostridia bacterium]|nr:PH domain-containing protein [Clostridia bacterium]
MQTTEQPNYVATKSAWRGVSFWCILFCWLIVPLIVMIVRIIALKNEKIEFYDSYIVVKKGILNKSEERSAMTSILGVSINKPFWGRIFGYGDVKVDVIGNWDINTQGVKNPEGLKNYLIPFISAKGINQNIFN